MFEPGYILFGKLRPYLRKFLFCTFDGICSTEIWPIIVDHNVCEPRYFYYYVQTEGFIAAANISSGSKMPRADWDIVSAIEVNAPPLVEQRAIVEILDDIENCIHLFIEYKVQLEKEKAALMQQLLTGKRPVKTPSDQAEAA